MSETTATRPVRQRRKPERFCKLSRVGKDVVLVIRVKLSKTREQLDSYTLESIASDHGRGLLLHKADGTSYAVRLSGPDSTCDCKGHVAHGHCKHVESLLALQERGKL